MIQVEIVAQEAVATSAIEGITLGLQDRSSYNRNEKAPVPYGFPGIFEFSDC
jgi:hypothetical protein